MLGDSSITVGTIVRIVGTPLSHNQYRNLWMTLNIGNCFCVEIAFNANFKGILWS
jgi:hypothetical protein